MVHRIKNRLFSSNTYLLTKSGQNKCIIIDPGLDAEKIDELIKLNDLTPIAIICTHGHFDHIANVAFFKKKYSNIPYYLHIADKKIAKSANFFLKLANIKYWIEYVEPDFLFLKESETIFIDDFFFLIRKLPGHSEGSCVIQYENILFSGDIIYKKGLGFNNFPGENQAVLKESLKILIRSFDKTNIVYPGHGESEVLGKIVKENIELMNFINT